MQIKIILIVIAAIPLVWGLTLSPWWIRLMWPRLRWAFAQEETVRAKLLELNAKHPYRFRDGGWITLYDEEYFHTHYAVFKADDGKQYTMVVTKAQYQELMQGSIGLLKRKGNWFRGFQVESVPNRRFDD